MRQKLAECARVDEAKDIADKAEALRVYARQAHDVEAETLMAEVKLRAIRRIGEISLTLDKAPHGPGRGHKRCPGSGTPFKRETLKKARLSKSRVHRADMVSRIPLEDFERPIAQAREHNRPIRIEDLLHTVVKGRHIDGAVRSDLWHNQTDRLFRPVTTGSRPVAGERLYKEAINLTPLDLLRLVLALSAHLPKKRRLLLRFEAEKVDAILQDLTTRVPFDQHEAYLERLLRGEAEPFLMVDWNEITGEEEAAGDEEGAHDGDEA
jgi:hypothetical protein